MASLSGPPTSSLTLDIAKTALVIIDMQNAFVSSDGSCAKRGRNVERNQGTVEPIRQLAEAFRRVRAPVVFTKMWFRPDYADAGLMAELSPTAKAFGFCVAGSWDAEIIAELAPAECDYIVTKNRFSAFYNTDLETLLRGLKVEALVVTGVATNICVESTIRDAFFRDYHVLLPRETTSSFTEEMESASLTTVGVSFAKIVTVADVLSALRGQQR